jgi:hypothetical protein
MTMGPSAGRRAKTFITVRVCRRRWAVRLRKLEQERATGQ